MKKIFFNILGFVAGVISVVIVNSIATWLLIDIIGSLGFITALLSWPVDYATYAFSGIIISEALLGMFVCAFITKIGKPKYNYSCFVLGVLRIIVWFATFINMFQEHGFNLDLIWMALLSVAVYAFSTFSFGTNEEM